MIKFYYFAATDKLNKSLFDDSIRTLYSSYIEIEYFNDFSGVIVADENFNIRLNLICDTLTMDLNNKFVFLESYKLLNLAEKTTNKLLIDKKYGSFAMSFVIMQYYISGYKDLYFELKKEFLSIDKELLNTAIAYINCNMNASLAAKTIYVHRNTFNYRLNKFIEVTQLDIRDYNNSLYLLDYLLIESNT